MSGFGALISLAFAVFVLLQSFSYLLLISESVVKTFSSLPDTVQPPNNYELHLLGVEGNKTYFKVVNKGPRDLSVKNLLQADLIIIYFNADGERKAINIPYKPGSTTSDARWYITAVHHDDYPGEILDPIDLASGVEGIWNVGEALLCVAELAEEINASMPVYLKLGVVG